MQRCDKATNDTKALVVQVYNMLTCLAWTVNIKGFWAAITTDYVVPYFTREWFSDEQENQMLYLLRQQVWRERLQDGIDVTNTFFIQQLTEIFQDLEKDKYAMNPAYAWI